MPRSVYLSGTLAERASFYRARVAARRFRMPVLITGCAAQTARWTSRILPAEGTAAPTLAAESDARTAVEYLGQEVPDLVLDAHQGLNPDVLGIAAGLVMAGGFFVVRAPPLGCWPRGVDQALRRIAQHPYDAGAFHGHFLRRLARVVADDRGVWHITAHGETTPALPLSELPQPPADSDCQTHDQARVVAGMLAALTAEAPSPAVVRADRGRGKTAALGLAAARILARDEAARVTITAPSRRAVDSAEQALHRYSEHTGGERLRARLRFRAPSEIAAHPDSQAILLVDEAAALPAALLARLLACHPRIAFATTVHGYEGTGRGFDIRFRQVLDRETPGWRELRLLPPIRWASGDPLEASIARLLALDAECSSAPGEDASIAQEPKQRLAATEPRLRACFGLLIDAHYQTRPADLRLLVDAPYTRLWLDREGDRIQGACATTPEGGFDEREAAAIWRGSRRPRGHLMARSLAVHAGIADAPRARGQRITRIAVHPRRRRRGVGRALLSTAAVDAQADNIDYLGASFGATPELVAFWLAAGFRPLRLGTRRDVSTGLYAVFMARALSAFGEDLVAQAGAALANDLPWLLAEPLADIDRQTLAAIREALSGRGDDRRDDGAEALLFAQGQRAYEAALPALSRLAGGDPKTPPVLRAKVLLHEPWPRVAAMLGVAGRRRALTELRGIVRHWLSDCG